MQYLKITKVNASDSEERTFDLAGEERAEKILQESPLETWITPFVAHGYHKIPFFICFGIISLCEIDLAGVTIIDYCSI